MSRRAARLGNRASALLLGLSMAMANTACPAAPATRTLAATPAQLLELADALVQRGSSESAQRIWVLLSHDPRADVRNEARFRHAKLLATQGKENSAAVLLRQILDEKPDAAPVRLQLAHTLQQQGDVDGALRELRAVQASGLPAAVARLVDRYSQALRAQRPYGGSFQIALAPDSNINYATSSDTLGTVLGDFDIDDESKAKSGLGAAITGQAYRRFALGADGTSLLVRLSGLANLYGETQFNNIVLDLGAGPELQIGSSQINIEAGATQRWFGQKPYMRSTRLGVSLRRPLGKRSQLWLGGTAALVDNQINDLQDGRNFAGEIKVERALSATTGVGVNASATRESLKEAAYSATGWRLGVLGWRELGRMTLTAEAQMGRLRADERLSLFPDKRRDRVMRFSLGSTFRQLSFGGFAPVARIVLERNRSSIAFYDYKRRRTEFGFERAF